MGKFTVPKPGYKMVINTLSGLRRQVLFGMMKNCGLGFSKKVKVAKFGKDVKKSKMIFAGLRKQKQIDDMIAYLKTLK